MSNQLDWQKETNFRLERQVNTVDDKTTCLILKLKRRRLEIEVGKLKLQKRKIWNYFYFSEPGDELDGDRKHFQLLFLSPFVSRVSFFLSIQRKKNVVIK